VTDTIVVGLDGAGFDLLGPWLDAGELPNLERLIDGGVSGELQSVQPPVTSPNWKAYSTGKNPGKLGIFWWRNIDTENEHIYIPSERYNEHTEFWEILAEDEPVGVLGMPTTYPPKAVDSFVVSGAPDGRNDGYTYPPELEAELEERFDYRVTTRNRLKDETEAAFEEALDLIDLRFTVARRLMEEHDVSFLQMTTFYINLLHHHLWDHEYTLRGWKIIDSHLGSLLEEGHNVVLMSDHGHNEIRTVFRINRWLQREGYLTFDMGTSKTLHRFGIHADRLNRLVGRLDRLVPGYDVRDLAAELAPRWLLDSLPEESGEMGRGKIANADWDRTAALASEQGGVYLNVAPSLQRYEQLREELATRLGNLTDHEGRPVVDEVVYGEEEYAGPYLAEAPDLVVKQASGVHVSEKLGHEAVFTGTDENWRGVNTRRGLFAAHGPDFATGTIEDISILDLAPTILHLHGHDVPADMDGRVRTSVYADGSDAKEARGGPSTPLSETRGDGRGRS
jgi:predicted AlkP superfamily phosphohydrolase/phosphomutase